jgi:hypothetical protein
VQIETSKNLLFEVKVTMMNDKCTVAAVIHMAVMRMAFRNKAILVMAEACCRDGWISITAVIQDARSMFAEMVQVYTSMDPRPPHASKLKNRSQKNFRVLLVIRDRDYLPVLF